MDRYAVIYNPHSGQDHGESVGKKIEQALVKNQQTVELMPTKGPKDATRLAKKAAQAQFDIVVAVGGDGTINEVVSGLATLEQPPYLGIVPAGTVNNLARVLQIPLDIDQAIENLQQGHLQPLDVGQINDDYLISTMTLGILADSCFECYPERETKMGPLGFFKRRYSCISQASTLPFNN
ncbi:acylglycerol kinase family protein [Latilactobacillus sakei]